MAANTVSAQDILFYIAHSNDKTISEFVSTGGSTTVVSARGIRRDPHIDYTYALARVAGKGIRSISAWDPSSEQITVGSAFSSIVNAGEVIEIAGWDARERRLMFNCANIAIRAAFPFWWRETVVEAAASTLALLANTNSYSLPTDVSALLEIGVQANANSPVRWLGKVSEAPGWFFVEGQEGAFTIRFAPRYSREGGFHQVYAGKNLCTKYAVREAELTDESSTTQLPLAYFVVASAAFKMLYLGEDPEEAEPQARASLDMQQYALLAQMAQTELQKLMIAKVPPNPYVAPQQQSQESPSKKGRGE